MTITSETAKSGRVSHDVRMDGEEVRIKVSFGAGCQVSERRAYSITPEHARELAEALMEAAGQMRFVRQGRAFVASPGSCGQCDLRSLGDGCGLVPGEQRPPTCAGVRWNLEEA